MAVGIGCSASVSQNTGTAGSGAGGTDGAGAGGAGAGGMGGASGAGGSKGTPCTDTPAGIKVGQPSDFTTTGLHIVTGKGVLIGRDSGGLYALTALCPHQLCDMAAVDSQGPFGQLLAAGKEIECLCHGSIFGPTGAVMHGPATKPLKALDLALGCDGFLYVNKSKTVAGTQRLMV